MSDSATRFFDGLSAGRLVDESVSQELRARFNSSPADFEQVSRLAVDQGWLTPYQVRELRGGRGPMLILGGYRILDLIAEHISGRTFKAVHPALAHPVQLTLIDLHWLTPGEEATAYLNRLQAACLVQNQHLTNVLDAGMHEGSPFVVQEFVDGCDLGRMVNEMGAIPTSLACEYARQTALALQSAHEKGVVHGEVTPYSIVLTPVKRVTDPQTGYESIRPRSNASIKLTNLAVAPRRPAAEQMTFEHRDRFGRIEYLPPERLSESEHTAASDVYGLGASLYYLLTARPPHSGSSAVDTMLNLQQAHPVPVESLRTDVPPAVADLIALMLQRSPSARPTVPEILQAIYPHCEPSAMPAVSVPSAVLVASETLTIPGSPPPAYQSNEPNLPIAEVLPNLMAAPAPYPGPAVDGDPAPHIEPLPEIHPLDDHHDGGLDHFGHSDMTSGSTTPATPRVKQLPSRWNKPLLLVGLCLHLSATAMCLGYVGIIPNPFKSQTTEDSKPTPTKKATTKKKN